MALTYYISSTGSDSNPGTNSLPWRTLSKISTLLNYTTPSDTITFYIVGTYSTTERLTLYNVNTGGDASKQINIIATGITTLSRGTYNSSTGNSSGYLDSGTTTPVVLLSSCRYIKVQNLIVEAGGVGIQIAGSSNGTGASRNCTISGCEVRGCQRQGIQIWGKEDTYNNLIENCIVHDNALRNYNSARRDVYAYGDRYIYYPSDPGGDWDNGILVSWSYSSVEPDLNTNCGGNAGSLANGNVVRGCTVYNNWGEGLNGFSSKYTTFDNNTLYNNFSVSIYPEDSGNMLISNNFVYGTATSPWTYTTNGRGFETGIYITHERSGRPEPSNITIFNNIFINPKSAIWMVGIYLTNVVIEYNTYVYGPALWGPALFRWVDGNVNCTFRNNSINNGSNNIWAQDRYPTGFTGGYNTMSKRWTSYLTGDIQGTPLVAQTGLDYLNPGLHTKQYWAPLATSPTVGAGITSATTSVDTFGTTRSNPPTTGAIEYGSPSSPSWGSLPDGWLSGNIGSVELTGSDGYANGAWMITASGADVFGTVDSFRSIYKYITGDFDISIQVTRLDNTSTYAKAGLMLRNILTANSAHASISIQPSGDIETISRDITGNTSILGNFITPSTDTFIRLVREGNNVYRYHSANNNTWTSVANNYTSIIPDSVYVCVFACAQNNTTVTVAEFANLQLTTQVPTDFNSIDIGPVINEGTTNYSNGTFLLTSGGNLIYGTEDAFRYVYKSYMGDFVSIFNLLSLQDLATYSKCGLMIRDTLLANSACHTIHILPQNRVETFNRTNSGNTIYSDGIISSSNTWLKLVKNSNTISRFSSNNGIDWTPRGSIITRSFGNTVYQGLFLLANSVSNTIYANVNNFSISPVKFNNNLTRHTININTDFISTDTNYINLENIKPPYSVSVYPGVNSNVSVKVCNLVNSAILIPPDNQWEIWKNGIVSNTSTAFIDTAISALKIKRESGSNTCQYVVRTVI